MPQFIGPSTGGGSSSSGIDYKAPCRVASTANIATLSGLLTLDGVVLVAGDRVLVKNQTTGANNGIYVVASGAWSRAADANDNGELRSGAVITVSEGTVNADTAWMLTTNDPITIGTTSLTFTKFPTPEYGLKSTYWVDAATTATNQDGSISRPFSTIQAAIDAAVAASLPGCHIHVGLGDYSASALTVPPSKDIVIEGAIRRGTVNVGITLGAVNWTVTGDSTSRLVFRRVTVGALTVIDGVSPAVNAIVNYDQSQCSGVNTTGTSFLTLLLSGSTLAAFQQSNSPSVGCVVTGDVTVASGTIFMTNAQVRSTCTIFRSGTIFSLGCTFEQNIQATGIIIEFVDTFWKASSKSVTFTGAAGSVTIDALSKSSFVALNTSLVNGTFVLQKLVGPVQLGQAIAVEPSVAGGFNSASQWLTFILGSQTDAGGGSGNGGLYACARQGTLGSPPTNAPYTALSCWDYGGVGFAGAPDTGRVLYYGGGGWNAPDANAHEFYTAPTYTETVDTGPRRFGIYSSGACVVGADIPGSAGALQVLGSVGGIGLLSDLFPAQFDDQVRWTASISPTVITSSQNNYNPTGLANANIIRQDVSVASNLTGLAGGIAGRRLVLFNISVISLSVLTLTNEDASSTAANRFTLPAATVAIPLGGCVELWYDGTSSRWRLISKSF